MQIQEGHRVLSRRHSWHFSRYCMHRIHLEDDSKSSVEHQRRLNPNLKEVVKKKIIKLLDAGVIYPISESNCVSPVHVVQKWAESLW